MFLSIKINDNQVNLSFYQQTITEQQLDSNWEINRSTNLHTKYTIITDNIIFNNKEPDSPISEKNRSQTDRLRDLRSLINDAVIELLVFKHTVTQSQTGRSHNR